MPKRIHWSVFLGIVGDRDGKPVDVLPIGGAISYKRSRGLEDHLWNLIPEASDLREDVGRVDDGVG